MDSIDVIPGYDKTITLSETATRLVCMVLLFISDGSVSIRYETYNKSGSENVEWNLENTLTLTEEEYNCSLAANSDFITTAISTHKISCRTMQTCVASSSVLPHITTAEKESSENSVEPGALDSVDDMDTSILSQEEMDNLLDCENYLHYEQECRRLVALRREKNKSCHQASAPSKRRSQRLAGVRKEKKTGAGERVQAKNPNKDYREDGRDRHANSSGVFAG